MSDKQAEGVRAKNQAFKRYEQVEKTQDYHLSENDGDAFDHDFVIETVDMAPWFTGSPEGRQEVSSQLGSALESIGFAILTGHGIDPKLHQQTAALTREFFETTTLEQRMAYLAARHGSVNQGYFPIKQTTIIHPDLVEGWVFCRRAFDLDGDADFDPSKFWPRPEYEPKFREHVIAHDRLIKPIMQALLGYLGCDPHLYDERLTATNFGFRLNYYPATEGRPDGGRMLGHEDVDLFTLLPTPSSAGLQVLNRRNMKWIRLNAPPGAIILNTGDYMQRISNDRLPSTTHRVASCPGDDKPQARVSYPMAVYVWEDEVLEVLPGLGQPKYPPIRAETFHTRITSKYYGDDYSSSSASGSS